MKKSLKASFLGVLFTFGIFNAQVVTETQTIGNTELTITMDKRVSDGIKAIEDGCNKKAKYNNNTTENDNVAKTQSTRTTPNNQNLSQAEICRKNPRILGYKIQVAVVKSKEEADKIRTDFRAKFPSIKVEVDASLRPNYRILAGSYYTKQSASGDLRRVRSAFGSANAVQYRVFCAEAK